MRCGECGHDNPVDSAFCEECGSSFAPVCAACQKENNRTAKFCRHCGEDISVSPAQEAQPTTVEQDDDEPDQPQPDDAETITDVEQITGTTE